MLGGILHVSINGPEIDDSEYDSMIQRCCTKFMSMKKFPGQLKSLEPADNITLMEYASVQVDLDVEQNEHLMDQVKSLRN